MGPTLHQQSWRLNVSFFPLETKYSDSHYWGDKLDNRFCSSNWVIHGKLGSETMVALGSGKKLTFQLRKRNFWSKTNHSGNKFLKLLWAKWVKQAVAVNIRGQHIVDFILFNLWISVPRELIVQKIYTAYLITHSIGFFSKPSQNRNDSHFYHGYQIIATTTSANRQIQQLRKTAAS